MIWFDVLGLLILSDVVGFILFVGVGDGKIDIVLWELVFMVV